MRLALMLSLTALSACSWFSPGPSEVFELDSGPAGLPEGPACRPPDEAKRGTPPWSKGDKLGEWTITDVDFSNVESAIFTLSDGNDTTAIEVGYTEGEPGAWSTARSRLMPAKDHEPPQVVLEAAIAHLRAFDTAHASEPLFVRKRAGVIDLYEGLPPCTTEQDTQRAREAAEHLKTSLAERGIDKAVEVTTDEAQAEPAAEGAENTAPEAASEPSDAPTEQAPTATEPSP